jgi:4-hydroxythreonine-4-phosphate dehydrogenase
VLGYLRVVSLLIGLPIIRTSTGHGTAFDLVRAGIHPNPVNLIEAVKVATEFAQKRCPQRT